MTDRQGGREGRAREEKALLAMDRQKDGQAGRSRAVHCSWEALYLQHSWVHAWEHGYPLRVANRGPLQPGRLFIRLIPPGRLLFY